MADLRTDRLILIGPSEPICEGVLALRVGCYGRCHDGRMEFWSDPPEERRRAALQLWSKFPADRLRRPLVLLGSRVSGVGFETSAAKQAFLNGAIDVAVDAPVGVIEKLPGRRAQFRGSSITVMAATADQADFQTDRGMQRLPAWRLQITGMLTDCWVLDPAIRGWWPAGADGERLRNAGSSDGYLAADDLTVKIVVGVVSRDDVPTIEFTETKTAVLYERTATDPELRRPNLGLMTRQITATLPSRLGNRVLIDWHGVPTALTSSP
jgi:hypothetical protein